jgi:hypothetical protein
MFIKNSIYRTKIIIKIILNNKIAGSKNYLENSYQFFKYTYQIYHKSILKLREIKSNLINILLQFKGIYYNRKDIINYINSILNSISYKKIIIFFSSENKNIIDELTYTSIIKYLQESNSRKIIFVDINDNYKVNIILNRIYNNDIILGLGNLMLQYNFKKINIFPNFLDKNLNSRF